LLETAGSTNPADDAELLAAAVERWFIAQLPTVDRKDLSAPLRRLATFPRA
jgi:hypothetical protein